MDVLFYERNSKRYQSNVDVYVKEGFWNLFTHQKAKIIDFSIGGFKLEFIDEYKLKNQEKINLIIPLKMFNINNKKALKLKAEIKWVDPLNKQIGGTYIVPGKVFHEILEKIMAVLAQRIEKEQK